MPKIHKLSPALADMIAAGEVVERPASVIKELVENSIDAGAKKITVEIQNGGITFMRVTDDGCGISREDAPTAFLRHATSKISCADDLGRIETMGFRGEALAAISAVSKVDLMTRATEEELGTSIRVEAGNVLDVRSAGCPAGTTMVVRELFYNTPARMKFLKRDSVEGSYISGAVARQALGHPEIAFRFIRDGKQELNTPGDGRLSSAIYHVMGRTCAGEMVEVSGQTAGVKVAGYVGKPTASRGSRSYQHFFVNGRYVKSRTMMAALEEAYRNQLMVGRFPICVLSVELPPEAVDVNVHPAKTEVKFLRETDVHDAIQYAVLATLSRAEAKPELVLPGQGTRQTAASAPAGQLKPENRPAVPVQNNTPGAGKAAVPSGRREDFYQRMNAEEYRKMTGLLADAPRVTPSKGILEQMAQKPESVVSKVAEESPANAAKTENTEKHERHGTVTLHDSMKLTPVPEAAGTGSYAGRTEVTADGTFVIHSTGKRSEPEAVPTAVTEPKPESEPENTQLALELPEKPEKPEKQETPQLPIPQEPVVPADPDAKPVGAESKPREPYRIVGEVLKTYIIVEQGDAMLLIDKHAAHERILFEKLRTQKREIIPQLLLSPIPGEFSREETAVLLENTDLLSELGFEVEDFGGGTTLIRAIPADIREEDAEACLCELAEKLLDGTRPDASSVFDEMLHTVACKAAIKGGWDTNPAEIAALVAELMSRDDIKYCPHGRPVCVRLSQYNLEKQFKRT